MLLTDRQCDAKAGSVDSGSDPARLALALAGSTEASAVPWAALAALPAGQAAWAVLVRLADDRYLAASGEGVGHAELRSLVTEAVGPTTLLCLERPVAAGTGRGRPRWAATRCGPGRPEVVLGCWPVADSRSAFRAADLEIAVRLIAATIASARAYEALLARTSRDPLTGLFNRSGIRDVLARETARAGRTGRPAAVLFLDLDQFKEINDHLGHTIGDEVLIGVAARLAGALRASDALGRLGGDEFLVVLPETGLRGACRIGRRLARRLASSPITTSFIPLSATLTFGASSLEEGLDGPELVDRADRRMLKRKQRRRARHELAGVRRLAPLVERVWAAIHG